MISGWLGRPPPTHFAHALHRETEGNPFFIEEVLRHLIEADAVDGTTWGPLASFTELGIPDGVREAIERRLATLSPAARRVVTMAAVIGRSFSIEVLDGLAELPGERLLEALEEAAERRIVEEEAGAPGRYTFAHALIRETLYASLSGPRRVGLHRRIGAILEQQHASDTEPPLGELAYHFVAAATPEAAAKAVDYSGRAARRALASLAYEDAVSHFDRALEALELSKSPDEATRCELLLGLGESLGKAERVRSQRRRLPSRRGARADGGPRGALRPRSAGPRPGLDRAGHRGSGDHRAAAGGARRSARARYGAAGQAARPPRDGASLLQRARALSGRGARGRGARPEAG